MVVLNTVSGEEFLQSSVLLLDSFFLPGGKGKVLLQVENFLLQSLHVVLLAFAVSSDNVSSIASQDPR